MRPACPAALNAGLARVVAALGKVVRLRRAVVRRHRRRADAELARQVEVDREVRERRERQVDGVAHERRARQDRRFRAPPNVSGFDDAATIAESLSRSAMSAAPISSGAVPNALLSTTRTRLAADARVHDLPERLIRDGRGRRETRARPGVGRRRSLTRLRSGTRGRASPTRRRTAGPRCARWRKRPRDERRRPGRDPMLLPALLGNRRSGGASECSDQQRARARGILGKGHVAPRHWSSRSYPTYRHAIEARRTHSVKDPSCDAGC